MNTQRKLAILADALDKVLENLDRMKETENEPKKRFYAHLEHDEFATMVKRLTNNTYTKGHVSYHVLPAFVNHNDVVIRCNDSDTIKRMNKSQALEIAHNAGMKIYGRRTEEIERHELPDNKTVIYYRLK